jgi:hypothetical protein
MLYSRGLIGKFQRSEREKISEANMSNASEGYKGISLYNKSLGLLNPKIHQFRFIAATCRIVRNRCFRIESGKFHLKQTLVEKNITR